MGLSCAHLVVLGGGIITYLARTGLQADAVRIAAVAGRHLLPLT